VISLRFVALSIGSKLMLPHSSRDCSKLYMSYTCFQSQNIKVYKPQLVIFPTDNTFLLGTCPLGLVKKRETGMYRDELESRYCLCSFLYFTPFTTVSIMCLKITYKTTSFKALWGRITQTFEIVKLLSKIQAQIWHWQIQFH